jgi:PAS domain S-box-containing protein
MAAKARRELGARVHAEEELRLSEDRCRTLYAHTPVMMHSLDMEYRLLALNECWADVMGYEPKEVIGRNAMELFTEESRRYQMEMTRPEAIRTGEFNDVPLQMINKSGEIVDVLLSGVAITNDDGEMIYSVSFLMDVTESTRAERERRTLEMKALSQSKLATLGEVATGVAHEINQPLTYINTTIQTLLEDFELDDLDTESAKSRLAESNRQVDRITTIVDHLRTFGRANETDLTPLQIDTVLDSSLTLLGERIKRLGIDLQRAAAPGVPDVMGNSSQIEQVFINLFQNSIEALAGKESGAFIAVSIRTPPDESEAEVVFSDNGSGVANDDANRVFEPFFTTKEPGKATDLGLSIAYSIIMDHGGSITCDSDPDKGTTITFSIPAVGSR